MAGCTAWTSDIRSAPAQRAAGLGMRFATSAAFWFFMALVFAGGVMEVRRPYFSGEDSLASNKAGAFLP
jgi:hypothetical protein